MDIFAEFQERIERGIQFLDLVKLEWFDEIDLDDFDLNSANDCVIGQVFPQDGWTGGYVYLERVLGADMMYEMGFLARADGDFQIDEEHFSNCPDYDCERCENSYIESSALMQNMWEYEIRKRQSKTSV